MDNYEIEELLKGSTTIDDLVMADIDYEVERGKIVVEQELQGFRNFSYPIEKMIKLLVRVKENVLRVLPEVTDVSFSMKNGPAYVTYCRRETDNECRLRVRYERRQQATEVWKKMCQEEAREQKKINAAIYKDRITKKLYREVMVQVLADIAVGKTGEDLQG